MIKWIDAIKNPPTRSGEYLVWFGDRPDEDPDNCTMVVPYSARHREWNCYDDLPTRENRFTNVTHYAVINNPAESEACDERRP